MLLYGKQRKGAGTHQRKGKGCESQYSDRILFPYKPEFSDEDNRKIIETINQANPDLLWIGMTAPKQEKWTYQHWKDLKVNCHVGNIGAVFDFFADTVERAPLWWQEHSLEWLYRLIRHRKECGGDISSETFYF